MKFIKSLIPYIIIIIVVILIRSFIVTPVKVNGTSMYPTLKGGEVMLLNKLGKPKRFDIVVLKIDKENDNLIKRVIGLPGETVEIRNNKIYVNDKELDDKYGFGDTYDVRKVKLKSDEYFVLGDNRKISLDSRVFGTVKENEIKGTTSFIIYPFKKFGKVSFNETKDNNKTPEHEIDAAEYVDKKIDELITSENYKKLSTEDRYIETEKLLKNLKKDGYIKNYNYDSEGKLFSFTYSTDILGGIALEESDEITN